MVEVAETEMVLLSILCDILENREYADIIANALVVWPSAAESLISGNGVPRTKSYSQVTQVTQVYSDVSSTNQKCKFYLMCLWNEQNGGSLVFWIWSLQLC